MAVFQKPSLLPRTPTNGDALVKSELRRNSQHDGEVLSPPTENRWKLVAVGFRNASFVAQLGNIHNYITA